MVTGCSAPESGEAPLGASGTQVLMDYTLAGGFYSAPFPDDARLDARGRARLAGFPNTTGAALVDASIALIERDTTGFSTTAALYFTLDAPLAPQVEQGPEASLEPGAPVSLIELETGARLPISVHFDADGGAFGAPQLLSLVPLQGVPLRPKARYAAVVRRSVLDAAGARLGVSRALGQLLAGRTPAGMTPAVAAEHHEALAALERAGVPRAELAGLAVFTTGDPTAGTFAVVRAMLARPLPEPAQPFVAEEVFDDYCVLRSTLPMPVYQRGTPPFKVEGGDWEFDAAGVPVLHGSETARIVLSVPRQKMPEAGFPVVLFSRTGGGGDRPLVDRGLQPGTGQPALVAGSGPARDFARVGWAGVSVDGPHGGLRNVSGRDEQFLMFNIDNIAALRDNVRQSAAELALQAHVLAALELSASGCPGLDTGGRPVRFDVRHLTLMGHSMGATIAPLTLAVEPAFRAAILSGAGGSWIENVLYKQHPVHLAPIASLLLGTLGVPLVEQNPALSLFQWAAESADPPVYAPSVVHAPVVGEPRHVLMVQGIVDHYIMPTISQATSLSLGLDFAGEELDARAPELAPFAPLAERLRFSGRTRLELPVQGNVGGTTTAVVVQQAEDGVQDGHEVVFQTEAPKHQIRCFLASLATGVPKVPPPGAEEAPCP